MNLLTSEQAGRLCRYTIDTAKVPSLDLMGRAGHFIANAALELLGGSDNCVVFTGSGNNGGDGYAAAAELLKSGKQVRVLSVTEPSSPDCLTMSARLSSMGCEPEPFEVMDDDEIEECLRSCGVIVDAIFGVGFHPPMIREARRAAEFINSSEVPVVSADIPSGVDADSGIADPAAVYANITVTFTYPKTGQLITPGVLRCGEIRTEDIGIAVPENEFFPFESTEGISLPARQLDSHKGDFGHVLIIAGSTGYTGAPSLAAQAAVRSGAGLVSLGVPSDIYAIEAVKNTEAMVFPLPCGPDGTLSSSAEDGILKRMEKSTVCLVGPGLGRSEGTLKIIESILKNSNIPVILDADGLNAAATDTKMIDRASCPVILTPHDGEFLRLGGDCDTWGRLSGALDFASKHNAVTVLKGYHTITAFPDGTACINTTGGPGLSKGGSGDVLSGIVAAFAAQFSDLHFAVPAAVFIHGKAGDRCAGLYGEYSMTPSDIIESLKHITS